MLGFKEYIEENYIIEARSRGEAMEEVIVNAINGSPMGDEQFGISADAGIKVAEFLKNNGIVGKGEVLGASQIEVSKEWSKFWEGGNVPAATKTPKTDFMVGNAKISLKSGDSAQLMSGGKNESLATFYTALNQTSNIELEMSKKLTSMFEGLAPASVASSDLKSVIKNQTDEIVNKANLAHKELMGELKTIFNSNTEFRNAFAYEAMSGDVKFGKNKGSCSHFLVTTFDGNKVSLHPVNDKPYVDKIAKQMKVSVRFKTTSVKKKVNGKSIKTGEYRYWSAIGLIIDKMQEEIETLNNDKFLTENVVINFFKNVWNRIKSVIAKSAEYIKQNVKNLFDFLEIAPIISFNNNINF